MRRGALVISAKLETLHPVWVRIGSRTGRGRSSAPLCHAQPDVHLTQSEFQFLTLGFQRDLALRPTGAERRTVPSPNSPIPVIHYLPRHSIWRTAAGTDNTTRDSSSRHVFEALPILISFHKTQTADSPRTDHTRQESAALQVRRFARHLRSLPRMHSPHADEKERRLQANNITAEADILSHDRQTNPGCNAKRVEPLSLGLPRW